MANSRQPSPPLKTGLKLLPLPNALWAHHAQSLGQWMREWREAKRLPPVLLLTGLEGVGKREVAYHLSQWVLCERSGFGPAGAGPLRGEDGDSFLFGEALPPPATTPGPAASGAPLSGCGECIACKRSLEGSWVDFREIRAEGADEEDEGGGARAALKIDQFRDLRASLGFGSHEGGYRITLISGAETLTPQAANSLLKLLEEPPKQWVLLLTATDASLLLPTLVSRCQRVRLRPMGTEALAQALLARGFPAERSREIARLSQGSWKRAMASLDEGFWEQRKAVFRFLRDPAREAGSLLDWATQKPRNIEWLVTTLEQQAMDLLAWNLAPAPRAPEGFDWTSRDGMHELLSHAEAVTARLGGPSQARAFWLERAQRLGTARRELATPMNRKVLAQELVYSWVLPR